MAQAPRNRPHFLVQGGGESEIYTSPRRSSTGLPPPRARAAHAAKLEQALRQAIAGARQQLQTRDPQLAEGEAGFYLDFEVPVEHRAALDALENRPKKIELVAVRPLGEDAETVLATVFVPEAQAEYYSNKIEQYRDEETARGNPKNQNLVARIEEVRLSTLRSLFTDADDLFPADGVRVWWEVWLRERRLNHFCTVADRLEVSVKPHVVSFPERDVVLALADTATMTRLVANTDAVAELRVPKDSPSFFLGMRPVEQAAWADDLADRAIPPGALAPAVCLLDSGCTRGHPLIAPGLDPQDQHTYEDAWGVNDSSFWNGHGTMMAGVALYRDLEAALSTGEMIELTHRLETVKVLPPNSQNDPALYGAVTEVGIDKAEAAAPGRHRVFCMAVTSSVGLGRGRPSSWSAAVDKLCYGGGDERRLMVLSAGNIRDSIMADEYLDANDLAEAENPAKLGMRSWLEPTPTKRSSATPTS